MLASLTSLLCLLAAPTANATTTTWTGAEVYAEWNETSMNTNLGTRQYSVEGNDLRIVGATEVSCLGWPGAYSGRCGTDRTFNLPVTCEDDSLSITVTYSPVVTGLNHHDNDLLIGIGDDDQVLFNAYGDTGLGLQSYYYATDYNTLSSYDIFEINTGWYNSLTDGVITATFDVDRSAGTSWDLSADASQASRTASASGTATGAQIPDGDLQFELIMGDRFEEYVLHTVSISGCSAVTADSDGDGIDDDADNCPDDANATQVDFDEDGEGDACDSDADGDGEDNTTDCDDLDPARYSSAIEVCDDVIDNDCDGLVDLDDTDVVLDAADSDCDGDGYTYAYDNCVDDYNPGQSDLDGDWDGDVCDLDDDGDGVDDDIDNCPVDANSSQADTDGDGVGDTCDTDTDGDGVLNVDDQCSGTTADAPTKALGQNRWADVDGDGEFDTKGKNPTGRYFTLDDTLGCSCEQIIDTCGYGTGHEKHGCSNSVMDTWTGLYDEAGGAAGTCKAE